RVAAALAATAVPLFAAAQQVAMHTLEPVTVTGGTPTSLPTQIPTTIEGIGREQIDEQINATDSEDAIKYLPSLLVRKRYPGDYNHAVLSTRASGTGNSARSLVYADGILLSNLLGNGATFAPRWMLVTPEEIERVDVLYGPFTAAYPGNSVGAVVDFVTRMPTKFESHASLSSTWQPFDLYGTHGNFGAQQASASVGDRQGGFAWWLNVNRTQSDGQPLTFATRLLSQGSAAAATPVTGAVAGLNRANQPWWILGAGTQYRSDQDHLKAKLAYDVTPALRASYTFALWRNDSQARSQSYLRDAAGQPVYSGTVSIDGRSYTLSPSDFPSSNESLTHTMHGLTLKSHTLGEWDWELSASHYGYDEDLLRAPTTALPAASAGGPGRIVDMHGTGWTTLAAKGIWRPRSHIVEFGLQRDAYRLRSIENATSDWIAGGPGARNNAFQGDTTLTSLYAQDTWTLSRRWKTTLGLRLEQWHAFDGATSNATTTAAHVERREDYASPKAALSYRLNDDWVLKASTGRAVRMPTVSELYQGGINASGQLINNDPFLRPEKSWTGELSAVRDVNDGSLRFTAFFERTRDALFSQLNAANVNTVQNVGAIRTRGFEVAWQRSDWWVKGLDAGANLTWTDSIITRNDAFPASVGKRQPRVPEWRAATVATYRPDARWSLTGALRFSGKQFSTLDNSDPNGFAYQGASRYLVADVRAVWRVNERVQAAFGIDNLTSQVYWNFHPYPQRSYVAELKADL
ncbi:MAG TPA: TonB-dependent receptor, partial [Ramlibacter sp.]|uniref:TonB-dependent receptor n=1 Tax=Ramlibacter sp. TaxID=1917967 RepID=UPI002C4D569D